MASKTDTWKSKQWYNIIAPEMNNKKNIGETIADDPDKLIGRIVETTLSDLTNDYSKQNIKLNFRINKVGGDSAYTKFIGHTLTQEYLRSLIKRHSSTIDSNVIVTTKDGYKIQVKPSCYTIKRARSKQIKEIRKKMNEVIKQRAKETNMESFIQEIITGKLSSNIYKNAKTIYPLRRVEIRKTKIISEPASAS